MHQHTSTRAGVTVLELLVSLGVIGILAAILLPAIQAGRETSRRIGCLNNVHQLGLSITNYESRHGVFPFGGGEQWLQNVMPGIEIQEADSGSKAGLRCPTDPIAMGILSNPSYFSNDGFGFIETGGYISQVKNGMYAVNPIMGIKVRDITDGLSNTAMISERLAYLDPLGLAGKPEDHIDTWSRRMLRTPNRNSQLDAFVDECQFNPLPPYPNANIFKSSGYTHALPPNSHSCLNGPDPLSYVAQDFFAVTATSLHAGGVNVAFADGSARFVSNVIDRRIWQGFGTRNGGEHKTHGEF